MKRSHLLFLFAGFTFGLFALSWSRAQTPSNLLKLIDPTTGKEFHTLLGDSHNALVAQLESTGQTNAIEMFRQYRCSRGATVGSSELAETVAALQYLREGRTNEAIQVLETHLGRNVSIMCNCYGCLNQTNRERVDLKSLEETRDYYRRFPTPESTSLQEALNAVLQIAGRTPTGLTPTNEIKIPR